VKDALRFETVRVGTIRSTYLVGLLGLLLCGLVALGLGLDLRGSDLSAAPVTLLIAAGGESLPFSVMGFAVAIIGVFATGHEYRYGTILPTLTAMPRRSSLLAAKIMIVAAVSAAAALAAVAFNLLVGRLTLGAPLPPLVESPIPAVLAGYIVLVMLHGILGAALGQLTRGITAAIVFVLITPLLIEPVITVLAQVEALSWLGDVVPYLPFTAGMRLVSAGMTEAGPEAGMLLGRWEGGAVFAGFIALLLAVAWLRFERRDA
jgi:ABC-type transport system involved in multi-copper enzyme maturation permease subunit